MIDRVKKLLEMEQLSPSQFADEINLQRSSLSHVLSGRNKPSLDFVMKIKVRFSEVNLDWLIFGKGNMFISQLPKESAAIPITNDESIVKEPQQAINFDLKPEKSIPEKVAEIEKPSPISNPVVTNANTGRANKVMILYNNGTFEEYVQNT